MMREYFKKNKHHYFPNIKDWTQPQDQWRYETNVSKLNFWQWFFCHPSAYKLMYYGIPITAAVNFGFWAGMAYKYGLGIIAVILGIIALLNIYLFTKRYKHRRYIHNTRITHYDLWMREDGH